MPFRISFVVGGMKLCEAIEDSLQLAVWNSLAIHFKNV